MRESELERIVLDKLREGLLDGPVGDDWNVGDYKTVTYRKVIINGIPQELRFGAGTKYFDNEETVRASGKTERVYTCETEEEQLDFLRKYGFLIDDPDVKEYSDLYYKSRGR